MNEVIKFVDAKYKAKSYSIALVFWILIVVGVIVIFGAIDHMRKSPEPLFGLFLKNKEQYKVENARLHTENDSLRELANEAADLKLQLQNETGVSFTRNPLIPNLGHYRDSLNLNKTNREAYLTDKMKFYYNKSEQLEKFIKDNF